MNGDWSARIELELVQIDLDLINMLTGSDITLGETGDRVMAEWMRYDLSPDSVRMREEQMDAIDEVLADAMRMLEQ